MDPRVDELSLVRVAGILVRNAKRITGAVVLGGGIALAGTFVLGRNYFAESMFLPQTRQPALGQFAGLAAQFGVDIASMSGGGGESVEFYISLVESKELLRSVVLTDFGFATDETLTDSLRGNLLDLYKISDGGRPLERRIAVAIKRLEKDVSASRVIGAGMIGLQTRAPWPELAILLNRRILELVNAFNLERRQSDAGTERRFIEQRLQVARDELQVAEDSLSHFLERNRTYSSSPQLAAEAARLQRRVDLRNGVYVSLSQAVETSRVEEVRNTPVVTIVDSPRVAKPVMRLAVIAILGFVLGGLLVVGVVFGGEYLAYVRRADAAGFEDLVHRLPGWLGGGGGTSTGVGNEPPLGGNSP